MSAQSSVVVNQSAIPAGMVIISAKFSRLRRQRSSLVLCTKSRRSTSRAVDPPVGLRGRPGASRSRRAALLGAATGISWGFMAAVIKELSSHLGDGPGAIFSTWSLYVLIAAGAVTMLLASHALASGPLAASQPGFTILDPLAASLLGVFLFGEHIRTGVTDLAGEALALGVVVAGAAVLSRSCLIAGENGHQPGERKTAVSLVTAGRAATPQARQANQDLDTRRAAA